MRYDPHQDCQLWEMTRRTNFWNSAKVFKGNAYDLRSCITGLTLPLVDAHYLFPSFSPGLLSIGCDWEESSGLGLLIVVLADVGEEQHVVVNGGAGGEFGGGRRSCTL